MKKRIFRIILLISIVTVSMSCGRQVTRVDSKKQIDISGRWNDTDSRMVAEELTKQVLGQRWLNNFVQANSGKKPTVVVGLVTNKSHEHIEAETFLKDIEKEFINSGSVRLVQAGDKREELRKERGDQQQYSSPETVKKWGRELGADFIMQGSINSIVDSYNKSKVVFYKINLELTDLETNEVVWIGDKEIKKLVEN